MSRVTQMHARNFLILLQKIYFVPTFLSLRIYLLEKIIAIICVASKRIETIFSYVMSQVSRIARDVKKVVELVEPKKEAFATLQKIS